MARTTSHADRRTLLWILGVVGALVVFGLGVLLTVVMLYRPGPVRSQPAPTTTPVTFTPAP